MAMCKECGNVVGAEAIENGICEACVEMGIVGEPEVTKKVTKELKRVDLGNPFSFRGRSGRLDFLIYGVLSFYGLLGAGYYISVLAGMAEIFVLFIFIAVFIGFAALVRRVRDREENIWLVILLAMVPYLGFIITLYLLLAPSKREVVLADKSNE